LQIDEMPLVLGDKNGVAQVLQQLIDNGLKFSPNGGTVIVTATHLENGVQIAVTDKGIGVDEDQIERIFQEFYQVEQGTTRRFGGAGTGLAIVKLILDRLGVNIEVKSRRGEGSVFSFVLPFAPQD
jgi:two-component system phosphate regulon sensor histidine kinase PhoR